MYKMETVARLRRMLEETPAKAAVTRRLLHAEPNGPQKLADILKRPDISAGRLLHTVGEPIPDSEVLEALETEIKYAGYIDKQMRQVEQFRALENRKLPRNTDYLSIQGLRIEARQKLQAAQPENIGQAARISGVSPADISVLLVYFDRT